MLIGVLFILVVAGHGRKELPAGVHRSQGAINTIWTPRYCEVGGCVGLVVVSVIALVMR